VTTYGWSTHAVWLVGHCNFNYPMASDFFSSRGLPAGLILNSAGEPELADRIILSLGLGSSGQDISPSLNYHPIVGPVNNLVALVLPDIALPINPSAICAGGSPTSGTGSPCSSQPTNSAPLRRNSRDTEQVCHQFTVPHSKYI
jgi:hypothetical protein